MSSEVFSGLDELFDYKNQLMEDLLTSHKIVRLLQDDCKPPARPEKLMYTQIFPYEYVPDTAEHGKTYICCEVDIHSVQNKTFLNPYIYIWIFTHQSRIRIPEHEGGGVRVDRLASEIVRTINGSRNYGLGELELVSVKRYSPVSTYLGRILTFTAKDYNRLHTFGKDPPPRRKYEPM